MPIYKGNTKIVKLYKGTTQIVKRYKGTDLIYSASRLPSEFQEVEYIESTGTQYIDSGYISKSYTNIIATAEPYSQTCEALFGSRIALANKDLRLLFSSIASVTAVLWNYYDSNLLSQNYLNKGTFEIKNQGFYYNGTLQSQSSDIVQESSTINTFIFAFNNNGIATSKGYWKLYSMQIIENNILIRNFVPCYRKADQVAGLYDLVNGVFYTNAGTGTFIVGGNV